jgi:F0F1-type ATP synthase assembly protein I
MTAGRRLALRAIVWQVVATTLVALAFLPLDAAYAVAAVAGGLAVAVAHATAAWLSYRGGVQPAGVVLSRWFIGVLVRWMVVLVALVLCFGVWRLAPLPVLAGAVAALLGQGAVALRR